jgi:hypothetical protein
VETIRSAEDLMCIDQDITVVPDDYNIYMQLGEDVKYCFYKKKASLFCTSVYGRYPCEKGTNNTERVGGFNKHKLS